MPIDFKNTPHIENETQKSDTYFNVFHTRVTVNNSAAAAPLPSLTNENLSMRITGIYQLRANLNHFTPAPLPPSNPSLELDAATQILYGETLFALGELKGLESHIRHKDRFVRAYLIKEAMLSSEIEEIHTTLIDIFTHTIDQESQSESTKLVINYIDAMNAALEMITTEGLPLSTRVLLKAHAVLLNTQRSSNAHPGHFRTLSVRVGNLIPPAASDIGNLMSELERFMNMHQETPPLIAAGLAHVQFETIHPFFDGNGRIGRLLIVLMLIKSGLLTSPLLYPSYFFKKSRNQYYENLDRVRTSGDFEGWITYYLTVIRDATLDALARIHHIEQFEQEMAERIAHEPCFQRNHATAHSLLHALFRMPIAATTALSSQIGKSYNTTASLLTEFVRLGIVEEAASNKGRAKRYHFTPYLRLLER